MKNLFLLLIMLLSCSLISGAQGVEKKISTVITHSWSRGSTIYEVNIRQFTPEGTFSALATHLPRLQEMGVDILWLMPIHPIGEKNRKGSLGSYYSIQNYLEVNPEFGNLDDFKHFVKKSHELGMKVIIDWVANHSSWDNPLITEHPEWYKKDSAGHIISPVADWTDVAALDYSQIGLRKFMTEALVYWIKETDIDGYRCDVAGMIPVSYWNEAVPQLQQIKPVFMLAEDENPVMHDTAFNVTYAWEFFHLMNDIAKGLKQPVKIPELIILEKEKYPGNAYRMRFTSNHDENSWNGTEYERMGEGAQAFAVLTFTCPGIPLIYSGQEAAVQKRLRFFDKDTIPWGSYALQDFYTKLTRLKKENKALGNGQEGGIFTCLSATNDSSVLAFIRQKDHDKVLVILNLSPLEQQCEIQDQHISGKYRELFSHQEKTLKPGSKFRLKPWEYFVYVAE